VDKCSYRVIIVNFEDDVLLKKPIKSPRKYGTCSKTAIRDFGNSRGRAIILEKSDTEILYTIKLKIRL
jgi:hypothetical protein